MIGQMLLKTSLEDQNKKIIFFLKLNNLRK